MRKINFIGNKQFYVVIGLIIITSIINKIPESSNKILFQSKIVISILLSIIAIVLIAKNFIADITTQFSKGALNKNIIIISGIISVILCIVILIIVYRMNIL